MKRHLFHLIIMVICLGFSTQSLGQSQRCAGQTIGNSSYTICIDIPDANENACTPPVIFGPPSQMQISDGIGSTVSSSQISELNDEPESWFNLNANQQYSGSKIEFTLPYVQTGNLHDEVKLEFGSGGSVWLDIDLYGGTPGYAVARSNLTVTTGDIILNALHNSDLIKITYYHPGGTNVYMQAATRIVTVGQYVETYSWWTTTTPELPQFILRDPPGDGSYSFIEEETQICRGHGMSLAVDGSTSYSGSVKLGVSGSAGFIVQTDYEAYAELSASLEMGVNVTSASEYEMCLTTTSQFSTDAGNSELTGSKGDVYMGSSTIYQYGKLHTLTFDGCAYPSVAKDLAFAPVATGSTFLYTEEHIENTLMPQLQSIIDDPGSSEAQKQQATDQLEVWQQLIDENAAIKANAPYSENKSFSGGTSQEHTLSTSTSEVRTVDMNIYIESSVANEFGIDVGGSGATGGVSVRMSTEKGSSSSSSNSNTNTVGYALADDDVGDQFNVDIYEDEVYGTPVFKLASGTASSCPFEGGYPLDQPHLTFIDNTQSATLNNIPVGEAGTYELFICNGSDEDRTYHLKVNATTNTSGAIIEGFGENISATDDGVMLNVPANDCLNGAIITIKQANTNILNYENIEMYLYPLCDGNEPEIQSTITLNANFADAPGNDIPCAAVTLPTDGSVQNGSNTGASTANDEVQLTPTVDDCNTSWCELGIQNSVWFKFTAPPSGGVEVSTCGMADFDSQIAVYSADNCNNFSTYGLIAANDDGPSSCATNFDSWLEIEGLNAGETYYILVDGYNGATGTFGISVTALQSPAPGNDAPCAAIPVPTDGSVQTGFTNENATVGTDEAVLAPTDNNCATAWCESSNAVNNSVWFSFMAPASGHVEISTCGMASFDSQLALFETNDCGNFNSYSLIAANDDCSTGVSSFMDVEGLNDGQIYFIMVDGYNGASGTFDISVTAIAPSGPANDAPCGAIPLLADGSVQSGFTNVNATVDTDEAGLTPTVSDCVNSWCELGIQNSVWFTFVAPASGGVEISTCDLADFDTQIALYEASDCGNYGTYNLLAANDDGPTSCATDYDSQMEVEGLNDGQTYYLLVDGYGGATGEFAISISPLQAPAPGNDAACAAIQLPVDGTVQPGFTNVNATVESGEPNLVPDANDCISSWCESSNEVHNSVWFSFDAPTSGRVEISTCDLADFNTQLAVYETGDCSSFGAYNLLAANDNGPSSCATGGDSQMEVNNLNAGQTYYIMVDGHDGATGNFGIKLTELTSPAPANDSPCAAISVPTDGTVQTGFTNVNATVESNEQNLAPTGSDCTTSWCEPTNTVNNSVWFSFVAPASGRVEISTCGLADFDTQLGLFQTNNCGNFNDYTLIAANDDGPTSCSTDFDSWMDVEGLTAGETYYIMVDGYQGANGAFGISVTEVVINSTIDNELSAVSLIASPNPNNGNFRVELSDLTETAELEITDLSGKVLFTQSVMANEQSFQVQLTDLPSGLYLMTLKTENQRLTEKLIIE